MKNDRLYYSIIGIVAERAQKILNYEQVENLVNLRGLAKKHHRQCENSCNGEGHIPNKGFFTTSNSNGYIKDDFSVFDQEIENIEAKIKDKISDLNTSFETWEESLDAGKNNRLQADFQHDPRGATVRLIFGETTENKIDITDVLYV